MRISLSFNELYSRAEENYAAGNHMEAIDFYERALPLLPPERKDILPKLLTNLGHSYDYTGEIEKSRGCYEKVFGIAKETKNKAGEVTALVSLSLCEYRVNEYTAAISILEDAIDICLDADYRKGLAEVYVQLSIIYDDLQAFSTAMHYIACALNIINENKSLFRYREIALAYKTLAAVQYSLSDYGLSIASSEKAELYDKLSRNNTGRSFTIRNIGMIYLMLEDYPRAVKYLKRALIMFMDTGNPLEIAWSYCQLARGYRLIKDKKTKDTLDIALRKANESNDSNLLGFVYQELAYYYLEIDKNISYGCLKTSIDYHRKVRDKIIYYEHHVGLNSLLGHDAFNSLIKLCIDLDRKEEALDIFEDSKSISFTNLMRTAKINPKVKTGKLYSYLKEEEEYLKQLRIIQTSPTFIRSMSDNDSVSELISKIDRLYDKMELIDPEYVALRRAKSVTASGVKAIANELGIIFLQYFVYSETIVYIFVISASVFDVIVVTLPFPLEKYYFSLKKDVDPEKFGHLNTNVKWTDLSAFLIAPVEKYLQNDKIICFVPSGGLYHIPLHSLKLNGDFIIKLHPIFYAASSSLFRYYRTREGVIPATCKAFALDDKRYLFEAEATDVAQIFDSKPVVNPSKEDFIRLSKGKDIVHLATHGEFINEKPMHSYVVLNNSEILEAAEIFNLDLRSNLVTLSACETGVSNVKSGDELLGLTHSLLYSGAASVVVSLWKVEDESTCELMSVFYEKLKAKMKKVVALQQAQINLIDNNKSIEQWAPFMMTGNYE